MRRLPAALGLGTAVLAGGGVATASGTPVLTADGPIQVRGTQAAAPFTIADRTVRQVRYVDHGAVRYTFSLTNHGALPVAVRGLADDQADPRLFDLVRLTPLELGPGDTARATLTLAMNGCESLSSRSGSFVGEVVLRTRRAGVLDDEVVLTLPEELHTGSAREASCPRATATSRPQG